MSPNDKVFKKEYAHELLRVAESDLDSAKVLSGAKKIRPENVLYHVGQCVEKALKATLCSKGRPVPLTHDIYAIVQTLDPSDLPPGGFGLHDLTPFTTVRRYEEGRDVISAKEIENAIELGKRVLEWAKKRVPNA